MPIDPPIAVGGAGSPDTGTLRTTLRCRRIAYRFAQSGSREAEGLPKPRVELMPQLVVDGPDGSAIAKVDTPLDGTGLEACFA